MLTGPEKQILDGSKRAGKTFGFREQDPTRPAQWWFQDSTERLAAPGASFVRPGDEDLLRRLEQFNRTQDFGLLDVAGAAEA